MAVFICKLIFKISRNEKAYIPVVCIIYVCGRGEGMGWVGEVLCGCVNERKR